jgi:hypothetical protein
MTWENQRVFHAVSMQPTSCAAAYQPTSAASDCLSTQLRNQSWLVPNKIYAPVTLETFPSVSIKVDN